MSVLTQSYSRKQHLMLGQHTQIRDPNESPLDNSLAKQSTYSHPKPQNDRTTTDVS